MPRHNAINEQLETRRNMTAVLNNWVGSTDSLIPVVGQGFSSNNGHDIARKEPM